MEIREYEHGTDAGTFAALWFFATGEHICNASPRTYNGVRS